VAYAHQRGIVHRDLKPANILLTTDGTPKITDFGLAKRLDSGGESAAHSGAIVGTAPYMAPEQALGRSDEVGPATDVYALGCILYELLIGRPPFEGRTFMAVLADVLHREPDPPSRIRPATPADLATICLKCLRKDAAQRYPSADALADDLRRFLHGLPIEARPASAAERLVKWAQRKPTAAALSLIAPLAVAATAVAGWDEYQVRDRRERVQERLTAGRVAAAREDWPAARAAFTEAATLLGDESPLAALEEAIRRQRQAREDAPGEYLGRAGRLLQEGKYTEAVRACDEALALNPTGPTAHRRRAEALLELAAADADVGRRRNIQADALRSLDACIAAGNADAAVYRARGQVRRRLGNLPGALDDLSRAATAQPDAPTFAERGWLYLLRGAPGQALLDFQEVLRRNERSSDAHAGRGLARARLGEAEAGVADAEEALRLGPPSSRLSYLGAVIYAQASACPGDKPRYEGRAVELLREALDRQPLESRATFWRDAVERDPALEPIRTSAGYQELRAGFAADR
jgi:tetratricopeptide (TPR) repeat protein